MRGKPFLQEAKADERSELLRRLAIALAAKPQPHNFTPDEKRETPRVTLQE